MTPTATTQEVRGSLEIHYEVTPGDRPILLVHGFASNSTLSWVNTGWLTAVEEAGRGAITVDLRGHGQSTHLHDAERYSPQLMAGDLVVALDAAGVPADSPVDVIAYSMGCRVALALAEVAPKRVRRLVLGGVGTRELFAEWDPDAAEAFLTEGTTADDKLMQQTLTIAMSVPGNDPLALLACIRGMAGGPVTRAPDVPTLVAAGERDEVASDAEELAAQLGAEFVSIPKRHHFTAVSSRVFKQAALDFLS